jgi:hypothetical protein
MKYFDVQSLSSLNHNVVKDVHCIRQCSYTIADGLFQTPGIPKHYKQPYLPLDLTVGYETHVRPQNQTSLEPVLRSLQHSQIALQGVDVISFRNNFNKLMATPYSPNE